MIKLMKDSQFVRAKFEMQKKIEIVVQSVHHLYFLLDMHIIC